MCLKGSITSVHFKDEKNDSETMYLFNKCCMVVRYFISGVARGFVLIAWK